jgi:hypothetical protein
MAIPSFTFPLTIRYQQVRKLILNGDLLLWRPTSLVGRCIARGTRAKYSHAALAGWWGDCLMSLEFLQWRGGSAVTLSSLVAAYPGKCHVYRLPGRTPDDRNRAVSRMARRMGSPYGWRDFAKLAAARLFGYEVESDSDTQAGRIADSAPLVCSSAVAAAWELSDLLLAPADLARLAEYRFTIV